MIAVDIIKIGEGSLDNLQIMTVPVKFRLASGQIVTITIEMITKGAIEMSIKKATNTTIITEMAIDLADKIVGKVRETICVTRRSLKWAMSDALLRRQQW
jgi:hypothetical protein